MEIKKNEPLKLTVTLPSRTVNLLHDIFVFDVGGNDLESYIIECVTKCAFDRLLDLSSVKLN